MNIEKFAWLEHAVERSELQLKAGPGFVTIRPHEGAHSTVGDLLTNPAKGWLISATAVLALKVGSEKRYPMLLRDAAAPVSPNKWQLPAGRCDVGECPEHTAVRELAEEIGVEGEVADWRAAVVLRGGPAVVYEAGLNTHRFNALWALDGNIFEFCIPLELELSSFDTVRLFDKEPYGRTVRLFTWGQIVEMAKTSELASGTQAVVLKFPDLPS